jgi:hypothetical protein
MITVVSGLPRSGTSMMMQMLKAGGMPVLADAARPPDVHNPHGYYEYAKVKALERDASWLHEAEGKAIKVVTPLLRHLPQDRDYRVVFMVRDIAAVIASQAKMPGGRDGVPAEVLCESFEVHVAAMRRWLAGQPRMCVLSCAYGDVLARPLAAAQRVAGFLAMRLDARAMAAAVIADLDRHGAGRQFGGGIVRQ